MAREKYQIDGQLALWDFMAQPFRIRKPVRLIELFGGIGSQAMAFKELGVPFEHYRLVEFDKYPVASYNAIHGTDFVPRDIRQMKGADLGIVEPWRYTYFMTYSFPCQDLSLAGKGAGMAKGSGTRSGLLWEVERLLNETEILPQVLLMENVPQVHGKKNMPDFQKWLDFLSGKGYQNFWQDLNARDFGVAQNRVRCFCVSILGGSSFSFPEPVPLTKTMKDYLEDEVDDKYYIKTEKAQKLIRNLIENGVLDETKALSVGNINPSGRGMNGNVYAGDVAPAITWKVRDDGLCGTITANGNTSSTHCGTFGVLQVPRGNNRGGMHEVCPAVTANCFQENNFLFGRYSIRKLTPRECFRLMGFSDEDFDRAAVVNSNTQLYKQAGNSIVKNVLVTVIGQMFEGCGEIYKNR